MNHDDRRHGVYGWAQRVEDIGRNLAETGHLHDEGLVGDLRAVPSGGPKPLSHPQLHHLHGVAGLAAGEGSGLVHLRCGGPEGSTTNEFRGPNEAVVKHLGGRANNFRWPLTPSHVGDR